MSTPAVHSMTGFGSAVVEGPHHRFEVRIRSVNHRALDLAVRLPEGAREAEARVRATVSSRLSRGRVEVTVEATPLEPVEPRIDIDRELLVALVEGGTAAVHGRLDVMPASLGELLRVPGVVTVSGGEAAWDADDAEALVGAVQSAVDDLEAFRAREGQALEAVFEAGFADLSRSVEVLAEARPAAVARARGRLESRLREIAGEAPLDPGRVEQEAVLLIERSDVEEELERLRGHLAHARESLASTRPLGKHLGFLLQEMQRELNTLAAKCRDLEMSRILVDAKTSCEQMREQVQNVE